MTISRPTRLTRPQHDLEDLIDFATDVARRRIDTRGKCARFAAVLPLDGLPILVDLPRQRTGPDHFDETGFETLVDMRNDIVAAAVGSVAYVTNQQTDAIRLDVEHVEGHAITVLLPFLRRPLRRQTDYGTRHLCQGHRHIWV